MEYIFTHTDDCLTLLNRKAITKEILFKYLHSKQIPFQKDFTKTNLAKRVVEYWNSECPIEDEKRYQNGLANECLQSTELACVTHNTHSSTSLSQESEFPINLLARKFSEWFFNNYNQNLLKPQDFWPDARLMLQITASDGCEEHSCDNANSLLDTLYETRKLFHFFFNPNLTHSGVQGRMDIHGLVLVLACGTLHTQMDCVGIFECSFGLMRDPFSENNWKTKTIQLMLRSKGAPSNPSLQESDTLKEALTLPVSQEDLS